MKKRLLVTAVAATMALSAMGALVACGDDETPAVNNADIAKQAIASVRGLYGNKEGDETPTSYDVIGQTPIDGVFYTVNWSVSSEAADYGNYVVVGGMDESTKMVTVSITKAEVVVEYTLTASITVGDATETASFTRKIPAGIAGVGQTEAALSFAEKAQRTSYSSSSQVWEQNGVKLTNTGSGIGDYANPIRLYKSSTVKIEYPGLTKVVFHSVQNYDDSPYVTRLQESLEATNLGTVAVNGNDVTLTLVSAMDSIEFALTAQCRLNSIDVVANTAGVTDTDKVTGAKAILDIANKNYTATGTYDLPATQNGANIAWAVKGTSENVAISEGKLVISSMPAAETEFTITATITSGEVSDTKDITLKLVPLGLTNDGTLEHPYTPSEAKIVTNLLAEGATGATDVYVRGYVVSCTFDSNYNNYNIYITDEYAADKDLNAADVFYLYAVNTGEHLNADGTGLNPRDLATFKGKLQLYKSGETVTPELTRGGECVAVEAAQRTDAEIVADAKAAVDLAKKTYSMSNEEVTLPETQNGATLAWAVTTETTLVEIAEGKLKIKSIPTTETQITLTVTITSNAASDTKTIVITVKPLALQHAGTQADPYTLADLQVIAEALDNSAYYANKGVYYVKGYVVDPGTYSEQYGNYSNIYLVDEYAADKDKNSEGAVQLYRLGLDSTYVTATQGLAKGDCVIVKGYIQKFSGKIQITHNGSGSNPTIVAKPGMEDTRTDAEKVAAAKTAVKLEKTAYKRANEEVDLPATEGETTLAWSLKAASEYVEIAEGKLKIKSLPATATTVTVVVTITSGSVSDTKEIDITVKTPTPVVAGTYKLSLTQANLHQKLYFTGTVSSNRGTTTTSPFEACNVVVEQSGEGFTLKVGEKYLEIVKSTSGTKTYYNLKLQDSSTAVWKYNADLEILTWTIDDVEYFLGTYNNYNTISASAISYISGANAGNVGVTQFVAGFETFDPATLTDAEKVGYALDDVSATLDNITATGDVTLPASTIDGVTLAWSLASDNTATCAIVSEGKLVVSALPEADQTVKLTVTATCGAASDTKAVTVVVKAPGNENSATLNFSTVTETGGVAITDGDATQLIKGYCNNANSLTSAKVTKAYKGSGAGSISLANTAGLLKFGTSKAGGALELQFDRAVTTVTIDCAGWGTGDKISITNATGTVIGAEQTIHATAASTRTTLTFTLSTASQTIIIKTANRALIFSIDVGFSTNTESTEGGEQTESQNLAPEAIVNDEQ